jgi:hypothetical protein
MPLSEDINGQAFIVVAAAYQGEEGFTIPMQMGQTNVVIGDLPTTDPHMKSALWNNGGAITISQG